jgi:hypothetical protein
MTDQLDEMMTDLRARSVPEIQPPGVAAARRTVRRRRVASVVTSACAVLAVVGVTVALGRQPAPTPAPVATDGTRLADAARHALPARTSGFVRQAPVTVGYQEQDRAHRGLLTVWVACAGEGQITLVVNGTPEKQAELGRVTAQCTANPAPQRMSLAASTTPGLTFRLAGAQSAVGRAGFAYLLVAETAGPPEPRNEPAAVLEQPGELQRMAGEASIPPGDDFHIDSTFNLLTNRSYVLAAACSGTGELVVRVSRGRTVVADHRVPCSWPPARHEFAMGRGAEQMSVSTRYRSAKSEPAPYAWAFVES